MLSVCSIGNEYQVNPTGARIYTPEQLTMYGLQDEKLVCTICGTPIYLYDGKRFQHYPNQPHRSEICSYLAYNDITFDYAKVDIRKLVSKWERIRFKVVKTVKSLSAEVSGDNNTEELRGGPEPKESETDQKLPKQGGIPADELLKELFRLTHGNEGEEHFLKEEPVKGTPFVEESSTIPSKGNKGSNKEFTHLKISKLKDFYTSGMAGFYPLKVLGSEADGTYHYAYQEIIPRFNAKYIFSRGLFDGGARVIEMVLDGYCDGRSVGPNYERGPSYLIFKSYWPERTDSESKTIWKNVRFLIHFRFDPKYYDEFKNQYMEFDPNLRFYLPKNKAQVYTVSAFFKKTNGSCEGKCYHCRQHNTIFCDNCIAQFEAEIVNPKNQMYLHDLDRHVDLGDPE